MFVEKWNNRWKSVLFLITVDILLFKNVNNVYNNIFYIYNIHIKAIVNNM